MGIKIKKKKKAVGPLLQETAAHLVSNQHIFGWSVVSVSQVTEICIWSLIFKKLQDGKKQQQQMSKLYYVQ